MIGSSFRDYIRSSEIPGVPEQRSEIIKLLLPLSQVGMNEIGIARNATYRQIIVPEYLAHALRLGDSDRIGCRKIDILKGEIELDCVEAERFNFLRLLLQRIREVPVKNTYL